jgi:ATP-binding cassette subfamily A (ABC1) protein 3
MALMEKKILNSWRNLLLLFIQILIPVSFISITIIIVRSWGGNRDLTPLKLNIRTYKPTVTTVQFDPTVWTDSIESRIYEHYRRQFNGLQKDNFQLDTITRDMTSHYLQKSREFLARVNRRYLFGATIQKLNITVWFNNQPYHTSPISLGMMHNAVMKMISNGNCSITVVNKPLPYRTESRMMMLQAGNNLGFQLSFNVGFAMAFVASFFVIAYIKERVTKAKLLQFVSGINVLMYWITAFMWDYLIIILISLLMTITIGAFQEDGYSTFEQLGRIYFVLIMFGFAVLPFIYIAAFFFHAPASGFTKMSIIFIFLGVAMYTVVFSMRFEGFNLRHIADTLTWIFLAIPHFSLSNAFTSIHTVNVFINICDRQCTILGICDQQKQCEVNSRCCSKIISRLLY